MRPLRDGDRVSTELPHVGRQPAGGIHRRGKPRWRCRRARMRCVFRQGGIEWVPVTPEHAEAARRAWRRFGKGNHPAGLNFGDCFAYALARTAGEPLLFKGRISPAPISRRRNRRNSACRRRPQGSSTSTTARASGDSRTARPTTRDPTRAPALPARNRPPHMPHTVISFSPVPSRRNILSSHDTPGVRSKTTRCPSSAAQRFMYAPVCSRPSRTVCSRLL